MFKRVISNPEEVGSVSKKQTHEEVGSAEDFGSEPSSATNLATEEASPPVVIEVEDNDPIEVEDNDPMEEASDSPAANVESSNEVGPETLTTELENVASGAIKAPAPLMRRAEALLVRANSKGSTGSSVASGVTGNSSNPSGSGNWGWFEDVHGDKKKSGGGHGMIPVPLDDIATPSQEEETAALAAAVTAPNYVLEESLSSQKLWKYTAGNRPPQPVEERAFFEKMWAQNFARSHVDYKVPVEVLTASSPIFLSPYADGNFDTGRGPELASYNFTPPSDDAKATDAEIADAIHRLHDTNTPREKPRSVVVNKTVKGSASDGDLTVLIRGDNVFGTTVSKSFARHSDNGGPIEGVDTVNISIASYRVVESKKRGKYAQFLVIYREGSIRDTIGVWKRYSDFDALSRKVTQAHESCSSVLANISPMAITEEPDVEHLPNAITSWRLLKKRQRWYRCLDSGYLSLKVFLLERFLHDILFESSSPGLLRDFVGADATAAKEGSEE